MSFEALEKKLNQINVKKICIIKPSAFGDVVQSLPLLPAIHQAFPKATISWVINSGLVSLIEDHPLIDEVILFKRKDNFSGRRELYRQLRDSNFDLVFDLQGLLRTALMSIATRAPLRVGLKTAREGAHLASHLIVPDTGKEVAAHRRYWKVAEALGAGNIKQIAQVQIPEADQTIAKNLLSKNNSYLAIQAGARWETKRWPVDKFAVVAGKAYRHFGYIPVLVGSPDESDIAKQFMKLYNQFSPDQPAINLTGKTSLKQLAAILQESDVLLTNDSGPMHLAASLGTPVVGIFSCTSPEKSGPADPMHRFATTQLSCAASYRKKCPYSGKKHMACHEEIEIERVWSLLKQSIEDQLDQSTTDNDESATPEAA